MDPRYVPPEWTRLQLVATTAVLWLLAQLVLYRGQQKRELTQHDYIDFLRRKKWKIYQQKTRREMVGNYLSIIEPIT
jgi:hypothetical protein